MKSKLLIKILQELDPSGDLEVSVGNTDIWGCQKLPSYYDGCQKLLVRDPENQWHDALKKGLVRSDGFKIIIDPYDFETCFLDHPDLPVEYDTDYAKRNNQERVEADRAEAIKICHEVDEEMKKK